jgi:hypothetical protein
MLTVKHVINDKAYLRMFVLLYLTGNKEGC